MCVHWHIPVWSLDSTIAWLCTHHLLPILTINAKAMGFTKNLVPFKLGVCRAEVISIIRSATLVRDLLPW